MRRSTGISASFFSLLRSGFAGAIALATLVSCTDSTAPREIVRIQVNSIEVVVPDSVKQGLAAEFASTLMNSPLGVSANVFASPALSVASSTCGAPVGSAAYTLSKVPFAPELIPNIAPYPVYDDGVIPASQVPLGFTFSFHGKQYDGVNVWSNGFLTFGALPAAPIPGFSSAGFIPLASAPNNMIAFAWTDWQPNMVSDPIRFETRGSAPNRRFIIQFNNVPEYASANRFNDIKTLGGLMTQIVLSEGSNDITIYTNKLKVVNSSHLVTQGIENETGSEALADSVRNPINGVWSKRIRNFFNLTEDAIRFSPVRVVDSENPSISAPENKTANNDPGLGSAVVAVGSPVASDNCALESVTSSRSDGLAIDAPYPVGVTTVTWTAKDASGNIATASQSITVIDVEDPTIVVPASFRVNATSPLGALVTYPLTASDNVAVTSLTCSPAFGSMLAIGVNPVTCTASDAAGHSVSGSFSVTVMDAATQLANLTLYLADLALPSGTGNPLLNELQQAASDIDGAIACKKLSDFQRMVIKKSRDIPSEDVAYLMNEAERIKVVLECQAS